MKKNTLLYFIISIVFLTSCEKNDDPGDENPELFMIANSISEDGSYSVGLFSRTDSLFEGYNKLYISVNQKETGSTVTEANLVLKPMMHMVGMMHSAPYENPESIASDEGYFEGAVVFIMPSNPDEGWVLTIDMNISGTETSAELEIPWVKYLEEPRKIKVTSGIDGTIYFVSCVEPSDPVVGINPCEFTVHYKESMMSFPAAENLVMEIEPEMPSMEHGSPNNENPIHTEMGHYVGKVNFTMTGWWRIHLTMKKGDDIVCDDKYMDITF
ncbi:MAG: FixH family protein [Bacteroidales bacterium]|nr:FixH family protein [Bacteroidales bacterium]